MRGIDGDVIDRLSKFSGSMLVLSMVDDAKLEDFIEVLDDKKEDLSEILSMGNMSEMYDSDVNPISVVSQTIIKTDDSELSRQEERFNKLITHLESIDNHLSEMLNIKHVDSPSNLTYSGWGSSTHDDFK